MAYADIDQLKADYLPDLKSTAEIAAVTRTLDNVSSFVDTYCRRTAGFFSPSAEAPSEKRVRGEDENFLRIPLHVFGSIDQVTENGIAIDIDLCYESDVNGWLYLDSDLLPKEPSWTDGQIYKVTARWGYAATPADLQEAVRQLVVKIWETQRGVLGQVTPNGFVIERAMPPFVREVLDRYKKRQFEI